MQKMREYLIALFFLSLFAHSTAETRIVNGTRVPLGELTNVLQIYVDNNIQAKAFECTATVVGEHWLLTAGHCAERSRLARIHKNGEDRPFLEAKEFYVHENFSYIMLPSESRDDDNLENFSDTLALKSGGDDIFVVSKIENDIALIRTESAIGVPPVRLAANYSHPHLNWLRVAGYGFLSYYFDEKGVIHLENETIDLWQTYLYANPKEMCTFLTDPQYNFTDFYGICMWRNGSTTLPGDSGGPAFAKGTDDQLYQAGIVSFFKIYTGYVLDIATDVSYYCPWIEETTKGEVRCQTFDAINMEPDFGEG